MKNPARVKFLTFSMSHGNGARYWYGYEWLCFGYEWVCIGKYG